MSLFKCKGIILKTQDFKENDKLIWMYTDKYGKISAIAKGAKKSKNKLFAVTVPLIYCDYVCFKGKSLANIQEGKIIKSFQINLDKLDKLTYSTYLCELIDIAVAEGESDERLFRELITTLYLLSTDAIEYELLVRSFELKLLKATGYGLTLDYCVECKKKIKVSNYISFSHFGGVCQECEKRYGVNISKGAYNALRFLETMPSDKIYRINLNPEIKKEIEKVTTHIIGSIYPKKPKSLEMLNYLKE